MRNNTVSLDFQKRAEYEMQQRLESIPRAKSFPMSRYEVLDKEIEMLEKAIKRLHAFVRFLSLLSPAKYIEWMKAAYARYVPSKVTTPSDMTEDNEFSFAKHEKSMSLKPGKASSKKKASTKRQTALTP